MNNLTVLHHKQTLIAIDADGMLSAELLAKQFDRSPSVCAYLKSPKRGWPGSWLK